MRKKFDWGWEKLDEYTYRAKVIGGWLVVNEITSTKGNCGNAMAFVPDRDHEWMIVPKQPEKAETKPPESLL